MAAKYGTVTMPIAWRVHLTRDGEDGMKQFLFVGTVHRVGNLYAIRPAREDRRKADYAHRGTAIAALKGLATSEDLSRNIMWR